MKAQNLACQEIFLQHLTTQITPHLSDCSLSVRRLLRIIGMSRSDLHRKLKEATGMSTTAYLRLLRLQRAAVLLKEKPYWSIHQIAQEVGFESRSYFTNKFREQFGMCPVAFRAAQ